MEQKTISLFKQVMGISPTIKVIEYLVEWEGYDLTITDIARGAGISRNNAYEIVLNLETKGVLKKTRTIGTSKFYVLNHENKIVQDLVHLFKDILKEKLSKIK